MSSPFERPKCIVCGREVSDDEVGLTKKLINRGAVEYLCIDCLAQRFETTVQALQERIEYFRNSGCGLFL